MKKKSAVLLGAVVFALLVMLSACGSKGQKPVVPSSNSTAAASQQSPAATESPAVTESPAQTSPSPTLADQQNFEKSIRSFAACIEKKDYKAAKQYCTEDFANYIQGLLDGTEPLADGFSDALLHGYTLKLSDVKGLYDNGSGAADYNISDDKPTLNFNITFEYKGANGKTHTAGGFVYPAVGKDGTLLLQGFTSDL